MIKKNFKKNGYDYKLIKQSQREKDKIIAIYEQLDHLQDAKIVAYEVMVIKFITIKKDKPRYNLKVGDEEIRYPSNNDWGTYGWTYKDLNKAEYKYSLLISQQSPEGIE